MLYYTVNNEVLEADAIYYVDPINGDDLNSGESPSMAIKTFGNALNTGTSNSSSFSFITTDIAQSYLIVLMEGEHVLSGTKGTFGQAKVSIVGQGLKTILRPANTTSRITYSTDSDNIVPLNIMNLMLYSFFTDPEANNNSYSAMIQSPNRPIHFKNVAFYYPGKGEFTYGWFHGANIFQNTYENCVDVSGTATRSFASLTKDSSEAQIILKNCYGSFRVKNENDATRLVEKHNTLLTGTPQLTEEYKIATTETEPWIGEGDGLNPDGTVANIGVYGGPLAWGEWTSDGEGTYPIQQKIKLTQIEHGLDPSKTLLERLDTLNALFVSGTIGAEDVFFPTGSEYLTLADYCQFVLDKINEPAPEPDPPEEGGTP